MESHSETHAADELLAQLGWVRALAQSLVRDPDVADDVLQRVCLLALQKAPRERRSGLTMQAWLATVTRRLAWHGNRADRRRQRHERGAARPEALPSTIDDAVHREALRGLVDAVTSLEQPYYSAIVARYFEGRTVAEIAQLEDASPDAIRQRLSRARRKLRSQLDAFLANDRRAWLLAVLPQGPAPAVVGGSVAKAPLAYLGGIIVAKTTSAVATVICLGLVVAGAVWFLDRDDVAGRQQSVPRSESVAPDGLAVAPGPLDREDASAPQALAPDDGTAGATSAAPSMGSLLARVIWATDRTPAVGVGIRGYFWDAPDPLFSARRGRTDDFGRWQVPDAPVGTASISVDRAEGGRVEVRAGAAAELTLEIPAGVFVRGLVLDADDQAVAGADIWLQYGPEDGAVVAQSGADGRFTVRDVGEHRSLGALFEGHVPSPMYVVTDDGTHECDVTLRLGSAGAHLAGRVVDTAGAPVAGVLVRIGPGFGWPRPDDSIGLVVTGQPPRRVFTDSQGDFSVRDMPPGSTPVAMRVHGHSPWNGSVTLHLGENDPLEVVLQASAIVQGVVSDESGKPIAGVRVSTGDYGDMDWVATKSGSDGRYELADLPLLDRELTALLKGWGQVTTKLNVSPGARLEWNPRLASGLQIFGRVIDARGAPVIGHHVEGQAYAPGGTTSVEADTDQQGRFTLRNCADHPHGLKVRTPDGSTVVASKQDVLPGPDEVLLQVGDTRRSAFIIGRIVDAQARVPRLTAVEAVAPWNNEGEPSAVQADSGNFRIGPLLPGEWDLFVVVGANPARKCGSFELAADETRNVGTITLPAAGRVIAHVTLPDGVVPDDVRCQLVSADHRPTGFLSFQDKSQPVWFADAVEAGSYEVVLGSKSGGPEQVVILPSRAPVHVEAGKDAEVDILAQRGVAQTVALSTARPNPPGARLRVTDEAGVAVCDEPVQWDQPKPGALQRVGHRRFIAVPGNYTLVITSDGREVWRQSLVLPGVVNVAPEVSVVVP